MMFVYPRETPSHTSTARAQPPAARRRRHSLYERDLNQKKLSSPAGDGDGGGGAGSDGDAGGVNYDDEALEEVQYIYNMCVCIYIYIYT